MSFNSWNGPKIVTNGLVGYWDAASKRSYPGSGTTWTDLSKEGNNGTLTNGPTFSSSDGGEIILDGTNDYVNLMSAMPTATNSATIEFWFKILTRATGYLYYFEKGSYDPEVRFYYDTGNSSMNFSGYDSGGYDWSFAVGDPADDEWHHLIGAWEDNNVKAYLDGVLMGSDTSSSLTMDTSDWHRIGTRNSELQPLHMSVAVMRIYDVHLSEAQVLQNYRALKGRFV